MHRIKNLEKLKAVSNDWKPSDVAFIKRFNLDLSTKELLIIFLCQIRNTITTGWPDTSKQFFEVSVKFENVSDLRINFSNAGLHQVSGFDILDVAENGMEGINFQIEDYENRSIEFVCMEVIIDSVSAPEFVTF